MFLVFKSIRLARYLGLLSNYLMRLSMMWRIIITASEICIIRQIIRKPYSLIVLLFIQFLTSLLPGRHSFKFWPISRHGFRYKQSFFLADTPEKVDNIHRAIIMFLVFDLNFFSCGRGWSIFYCLCSLFPIKYNIDQPRFNQYTIESMIYCSRLPNLVATSWSSRISQWIASESETAKYFES